MGINSITTQPKIFDKVSPEILNAPQKYTLPQAKTDTVELSTKQQPEKKGLSGQAKALIAAGATLLVTMGILAINRGRNKAATKKLEQLAKEAAERAAKSEAERAAAKAAEEAAEKVAKEAAERAAKRAAEKAAKKEAERIAKETAEKATKEAQERAAKEAAERAAKEAAEKATKEAQEKALQETKRKLEEETRARLEKYKKLDTTELNNKYTEANRAKDYDTMSAIEDAMYEQMPARIETLKIKGGNSVNTQTISRKNVSEAEYSAIAEYVDNYPYNTHLRRDAYKNKPMPKAVQLMDNVIERSKPLEEESYVYRAVSGFFDEQIQFMETLKEGNIIKDKSFVSTAKSVDKQFEYFLSRANSMALRIKLPKGTKGLNINASEFVLPRNSEIKIISIDKKHGIVDCEYILPNAK